MTSLQFARSMVWEHGQVSPTDTLDVNKGNDQGEERSIYWKADFGPNVEVAKNFYHELGDHGWGNNEAQNYVASPANSFHGKSNANDINADALIIRAIIDHSKPDRSSAYTSARLSTHVGLSRDRGCVSARITAPIAAGIWPAFWLLPQDPFSWPADGEVDIMEVWNGSPTNHSCLHWGHHNGADWNKHRVLETKTTHLSSPEGVLFSFAWFEDLASDDGKMIWYIDGVPVMRAYKPAGTRPMKDFRILLNIAVGGTVNKGTLPVDGTYEMIVRDLEAWDAPVGGWEAFERDWERAPDDVK